MNLNKANNYLVNKLKFLKKDRFNLAILESLKQYIYVFKEKKILNNKKNFGKLSIISETFQRCYLKDPKTDSYFSNLINDNRGRLYKIYLFLFKLFN